MNWKNGEPHLKRLPETREPKGPSSDGPFFLSKLLGLTLLFSCLACSQQEIDYPSRQMPAGIGQDQAALVVAEELFQRKCTYCHGHSSEGRGERADFFRPPAPDFLEHKYRTIDPAYLFWRIAEGKTAEPFLSQGSVMPAWGEHFADREIWALVVYLQRRSGSEN
jgi:mono/diheme cytochrome c family protein